jgi:hypothetical protein
MSKEIARGTVESSVERLTRDWRKGEERNSKA